MAGIFDFQLSLGRMRRMDGERVYVFSERAWARIDMSGPYPLLVFDNGERASWEDWPDIQAGGVYRRPPALKLWLLSRAERGRIPFGLGR